MAFRVDPENNETRALLDVVNFNGQHVIEIGCDAVAMKPVLMPKGGIAMIRIEKSIIINRPVDDLWKSLRKERIV